MIDPEDTGDHAEDVGRRLRQTRAALRIEDQCEFGEAAGLEQSLYIAGRDETLRTVQPYARLALSR
jgi:hypothetical protein